MHTDNKKMGRLYAGCTLPDGAVLLGTVTRDSGESGALVQLGSGVEVQYNAGVIRSLEPPKQLRGLSR
jgi:hypothetical protein